MVIRRSICGLTAMFAVCFAAMAIGQETVLIGPGINNGSFENPVVPEDNAAYNYLAAAPTDWSQTETCFLHNSPNGTYDVASDGNQSIAIALQDAQNAGDANGLANVVGITLEEGIVFQPYTVYTATMDISGNFWPGVSGGAWWLADTAASSVMQQEFTTGSSGTWEQPEPLVVDTILHPDFIGKRIVLGIANSMILPNGDRPQLWIDNVNLVATPSTTVLHPGDANGDGNVDELDAGFVATYWLTESGALWSQGDFNSDGAVDDQDATILAANWGYTSSPATSVPEPASLALIASAAIAIVMLRSRRRMN